MSKRTARAVGRVAQGRPSSAVDRVVGCFSVVREDVVLSGASGAPLPLPRLTCLGGACREPGRARRRRTHLHVDVVDVAVAVDEALQVLRRARVVEVAHEELRQPSGTSKSQYVVHACVLSPSVGGEGGWTLTQYLPTGPCNLFRAFSDSARSKATNAASVVGTTHRPVRLVLVSVAAHG